MVVNSEAIARAHFVEMGVTSAGAGRPEVVGLTNSVREKLAAADHPSRVVAEGPVNIDVLKSLIDANTQTRDATGVVVELNPGLNARTKVTAEKLTKIQKGEKADLVLLANDPQIVSALESLISQNPDSNTVYTNSSAAEKTTYRLKLLTEGKTKTEIARLLNENAGLGKLITDEVESLRIEGERLTQERNSLNTEKTTKEAELTRSQAEVQEYQTRVDLTATPPIIPGRFVTELATLQSEAEPLRQDVDILKRQIELLETQRTAAAGGKISVITGNRSTPTGGMNTKDRLDELDTMNANLESEIATKQGSLEAKTKQLQERDSKIAAITARKTALEEAITNAKTRIAEIDIKLAENGPKFAENQSKLHTAETKRKLEENTFASSIEGILTKAVESTINESMKTLVAEQVLIETTARDNAKTEQERHLRESIMGMYRNAVGNIDWNAFRGSWSQFLLNGSDAMLAAHLAAHPIPGLTMDQLRANAELYPTIIADLNVKMGRLRMSQPREGMLNGIRTRLLGPQPLSEIEIRGVVDRLGDEFFDKMLASNSKLKEQIAAAAGQNMVEGHRFSQVLRRLPLKSMGLILMILLGGGLLGASRT